MLMHTDNVVSQADKESEEETTSTKFLAMMTERATNAAAEWDVGGALDAYIDRRGRAPSVEEAGALLPHLLRPRPRAGL